MRQQELGIQPATETATSWPGNFVAFDGRFLFSACDGTAREVWTTDGTAPVNAGPPRRVKRKRSGGSKRR